MFFCPPMALKHGKGVSNKIQIIGGSPLLPNRLHFQNIFRALFFFPPTVMS